MSFSSGKKWDVLGLGAVAVDDLVYVEHYPVVDTKEPVRRWERQAGGLAGTALTAASRLGARAAYCGVLGEDDLSHFALIEFERFNVDTSPCISQAGARPIHSYVVVEIPTGSRTLFFDISGLREPPRELLTEDLIGSSRVLFVDHTVMGSAIQAAHIARSLGVLVTADIERGGDERLPELVSLVDHLVIGVEMGRQLSGENEPQQIVRALQSQDRAAVVITAGSQGCWFAERLGEIHHQPALRVQVMDTLGCGDVFHGAYAAGLARGLAVPDVVRLATTAAGIKATRTGGQAGIPDFDEVNNWSILAGGI